MKDEFIACPSCKTGQKLPQHDVCQRCYDEAMKGMECWAVRGHIKGCASCRKDIIINGETDVIYPEGMCQSCGKEPINNADEDFCFECKVNKSNL